MNFCQNGFHQRRQMEAFYLIPVRLPQSFMVKGHERKFHWFDVPPGQAIRGLQARHENVARVYMVTVETPAEYHYTHDRWSRMVNLHAPMELHG